MTTNMLFYFPPQDAAILRQRYRHLVSINSPAVSDSTHTNIIQVMNQIASSYQNFLMNLPNNRRGSHLHVLRQGLHLYYNNNMCSSRPRQAKNK